jgi:hypothetical protein
MTNIEFPGVGARVDAAEGAAQQRHLGAARNPLVKTTRQRILVMGATGFVGRALLPALLEEGHTLRAT